MRGIYADASEKVQSIGLERMEKMEKERRIPAVMKALVAYGKDDYRLEIEYPTPECGPDDIIIKTEACGICAGDLKCSHGAAMFLSLIHI